MKTEELIRFNFIKIIGLFFIVVFCGLVSCKPETCEEAIPKIDFVDIRVFGDTAKLTFSFIDCDGDFGLSQADTVEPYAYNVFVEYFAFTDTGFRKIEPLNPPFYYRVPVLEASSNSDVLEGEIDINIIPYYLPGFSDTMRYEVYILDKALNKSNVITTPSLIAPD